MKTPPKTGLSFDKGKLVVVHPVVEVKKKTKQTLNVDKKPI